MGSYIAFGVWYRRILILASVKQSDGLRGFPAPPTLSAHRRFLSILRLSLGTRELALWEQGHPCLPCDHVRIMNTLVKTISCSFLQLIFSTLNKLSPGVAKRSWISTRLRLINICIHFAPNRSKIFLDLACLNLSLSSNILYRIPSIALKTPMCRSIGCITEQISDPSGRNVSSTPPET